MAFRFTMSGRIRVIDPSADALSLWKYKQNEAAK